jgi:hypothetical protein
MPKSDNKKRMVSHFHLPKGLHMVKNKTSGMAVTDQTRRNMAIPERKDYIRAVKCMFSSPPKTKMFAQGVMNRYEDFVAMHINTTLGGQSSVIIYIDVSLNFVPPNIGINMHTFKGPETMLAMIWQNPFSPSVMSIMQNHGPEQILPFHRSASVRLMPSTRLNSF